MNSSDEIEIALEFAEGSTDFTKSTIVDVGCGMGNLVMYLTKRYKNTRVFGIDNEEIVKRGATKNPDISSSLKVGAGEKIPFDDNSVDVIVFQKSFHHCSDFEKTLCECERVLSNGGKIVFIEPIMEAEKDMSKLIGLIHDEREVQRKAYEWIKKGTKTLKMTKLEKTFEISRTYEDFENIVKNFYPSRQKEIFPKAKKIVQEFTERDKCKVEDLKFICVRRLNIMEKKHNKA